MSKNNEQLPADGKQATFSQLAEAIRAAHQELAGQASKAVNVCLTLRNWLIGCYIAEYELNGSDRAQYGQNLIEKLASELQDSLERCYTGRYLRLCKQFYTSYPKIRNSLISRFATLPIRKSLISQLPLLPLPVECEDKSALVGGSNATSPEVIVEKLSFTHIIELLKCDDDTKRTFYEIECTRGGWSVRELKRQIGSLYYERSGLSKDKKALSRLANQAARKEDVKLNIRDPYIFEFLGLEPAEVMSESHLEKVLIEKMQEFLLELGHGFCFESRQKRILIGDTHYFIDLVFYHRILKCHVLLELKTEPLSHENLGQLNTYVSWYEKNMREATDNLPVGILLCTDNDHALAEYALAGMDTQLFISQYQVQLPTKEQMQTFLDEQLRDVSE